MNILASRLDQHRLGHTPDDNSPYETAIVMEEPSILQHYMRIVLRWRWIIIGTIIAVMAIGLVITLLMTPQFTAASTIEILRESDQVTSFEGVERETSVADQEFYQTQYGLLRARTLAEHVATELSLVDDPEFFDMFNAANEGEPAFQITNGRYPAQGRAERQRIAGEILLENVNIEPTRL